MSSGAGRLERAILKVRFSIYDKGFSTEGNCLAVSTEEICRAVHPEVTLIEKKHRVAVLQAIHRIMDNPPRLMERGTKLRNCAKCASLQPVAFGNLNIICMTQTGSSRVPRSPARIINIICQS